MAEQNTGDKQLMIYAPRGLLRLPICTIPRSHICQRRDLWDCRGYMEARWRSDATDPTVVEESTPRLWSWSEGRCSISLCRRYPPTDLNRIWWCDWGIRWFALVVDLKWYHLVVDLRRWFRGRELGQFDVEAELDRQLRAWSTLDVTTRSLVYNWC